MEGRILNTVGLALVIVGCVLLYCFGLPPSVNREAYVFTVSYSLLARVFVRIERTVCRSELPVTFSTWKRFEVG